ncbi:MAG: hypothetical protein FWE33_01810 [Defluviitaleaceae bacterium]|nr:hypothetical protein [Defluviitaleaceae bacterium]
MIRGGIGSASIMLVFVVLCLAIFAIISLVPALTSQNLVNSEVGLVQDFFIADVIAEQIVDEILSSSQTPENIMGIGILSSQYEGLRHIVFAVPINEVQVLRVEIGVADDNSLEIFEWVMYNTNDWTADIDINVWQGFFE